MTTTTDYGVPPKKRVTTYGRASRRNTSSGGLGAFDNEKPASASKRLQNPPALSPTAAVDVKPTKKVDRRGRRASGNQDRPKSAQESRTVSVVASWDISQKDEEGTRVKKRKLANTPSTTRNVQSSAYSPPSSPPRSPTSAQTPNKNASLRNSRRPRQLNSRTHVTQDISALAKDSAQASLSSPEASVDLDVGGDPIAHTQQRIPLRLTRDGRSRPAVPTTAGPPAKVSTPKQGKPSVPTRRKKRLIDALVAQVEESSEDEEEPSSQDVEMTSVSTPPAPVLNSSPGLSVVEQPKPRTLTRQLSMSKKPGPKFTYSQQRTMLAEDPLLDPAGLGSVEDEPGKTPFLGLGAMAQPSTLNSFSFVDEEDDTVNSGAVRSLHELRQAGANSRFSDEIDDILDRIGCPTSKPSSLRRGALLELAQKMQEKNFRRQFRSHSGDGSLFTKLGRETDIIAGFAIVAILATLLSTSTSPHVIEKIRNQGVAQLLAQLLAETSDISVIAKERKSNVSRNGQSALSTIKASILQLPAWEPVSPTTLSPRTLGLKALDLILRQSTDLETEAAVFTPTVTDRLFSILAGFANPKCWELPSQPESVDFYLAMYLLETHSISAMQSQLGPRWTSQYLPVVADVLETALRRPVDKFDDLESLALRLTLNTTNNNPDAPGMFVERGILRDLAEAACKTFDVVLKSITDDSFLSKVLESLIFMLGAKINFCEHYTLAAQNLYEMEDDHFSPLNRLIRVFLDYHSTTADADSMEKTQLNVAFGYLSTLLGYLCRYPPIRERFVSIYSKSSLEPLLDSLREFILFHKVAAHGMEGDSSSNPQANAADRLQLLVDQLESES